MREWEPKPSALKEQQGTQRPGSKGKYGGEKIEWSLWGGSQHGLREKKEGARRVMAIMLESLILSRMKKTTDRLGKSMWYSDHHFQKHLSRYMRYGALSKDYESWSKV